jgi:hypothetical protein
MSLAIVKYQRPQQSNFDAFVAAMYLMFARAPRKATPNIDGSYELGEIGAAPEKSWTRLTPYSIARRQTCILDEEPSGMGFADECKCGDPGCIGHELVETQVAPNKMEEIVGIPGFTSRAVRDLSRHQVILFDQPIANLVCAAECDLVAEPDATLGREQFLTHWVLRG